MVLRKHFIFYFLSPPQLKEIISEMFMCKTKKGEFVFEKGSMGQTFFLIVEGEVEVIISEGNVLKTLERGSYFGDLSLIYNAPRSASIRVADGTLKKRMNGAQVLRTLQTLVEEEDDEEEDQPEKQDTEEDSETSIQRQDS